MNQLAPDLTNDGLAMLIEALDGDGIRFTRIVLGNGERPEDQKKVTHIGNPIIEIGITSMEKHENFVLLTGDYDNSSLENGFYVNEIGVFAQNTAGNEVLYAYRYSAANVDYIPDKDSGRIVETQLGIIVSIGTAENVTAILTEAAGYASKQEFDEHLKDTNNPHKVTKHDIGLGNVENNEFNDNITEFEEAEKAVNIESGETIGVTLGKIKRFISEFLAHLKAKNPHSITCMTINAATSTHKHSAADITTGILPVARGGTGGTTKAAACSSIGAVPKSGATDLTGDLWWANYTTGARGIGGFFADNDYWRVVGRSGSADNGYIELGTGDNGNDPILVRQYNDSEKGSGRWTSIKRTAYLLNGSGNTVFPGSCTATSHPTTSDLKKKDVEGKLNRELAQKIIMGLQPISYSFKGGKRKRMGFGAQDVFKLMQELGVENSAMYKADMKKARLFKEFPETDLDDNVILKTKDKKLDWSVDYQQIIAPLVCLVQMQEERIRKLEEQIGGKEN